MTKNTLINTKKPNIKYREEILTQTRILAEVVYGLSSRNCKGLGICKINAVQSTEQYLTSSPCGSSLAYLQVLDETTIRFDFLKNTISTTQFTERFADGAFCLEETFAFTSSFAETLSHCGAGLLKGSYPIFIKEEFISIEFVQF